MNLTTEKRKEAVIKIRKTFGENLTRYLKMRGKTQTDLATHLDVTRGAVSQWCNGYRVPSPDTVKLIAKFLNIDEEALTEERPEPNAAFTPNIQAPLFASISAGLGTARAEPIGTHPCVVHNKEEADNTLCVVVEGDSMSPKIENGDIIQIRQQRSVDSGDIAAVLLDDVDYFVKKVEYGADYIRLISLNANYQPILLKGADVQRCFVLGKVVTITNRC